jgi:hypothetical protein
MQKKNQEKIKDAGAGNSHHIDKAVGNSGIGSPNVDPARYPRRNRNQTGIPPPASLKQCTYLNQYIDQRQCHQIEDFHVFAFLQIWISYLSNSDAGFRHANDSCGPIAASQDIHASDGYRIYSGLCHLGAPFIIAQIKSPSSHNRRWGRGSLEAWSRVFRPMRIRFSRKMFSWKIWG